MKAKMTHGHSPWGHPDENVPSPEAIREMTAEIRKTWTAGEYRRRASLAPCVELTLMPSVPRRKGFGIDQSVG